MLRFIVSSVVVLLLAGCAVDQGSWSIEREVEGAALLSVLDTDYGVYVVGADDGEGPMVLRNVAGAWERLWTGDRGDLWWVAADHDGGVLMGGEDGRIIRYDPATAGLDFYRTPRTTTVFGIWVADDGTAFAVGGDVSGESSRGELWIRDGEEWMRDARIAAEWLDEVVLFKVWGTGPDDVWAVGERGTVLHFDGASWQRVPSPGSVRLLTIHGTAEDGPVMVGGAANGVLFEMEGGTLENRMPPFMPGANGVFVEPNGRAWAVGNDGFVLRRDRGEEWLAEDSPTTRHLHAVTVAADGTVWAVGGALLSPSLDQGIVVRLGH